MPSNCTVVVSHHVKPEKKEAFEKALNLVLEKAQSHKGYLGTQTVKMRNGEQEDYILLVRFGTEENYNRWAQSQTRKTWSKDLKNYVVKQSTIRYQEGLEFWFSEPMQKVVKAPKKWKMALLTWMVIYPSVLTLSALAGVYLGFVPMYVRMFLVSLTLVSLMTYFIMPKITKIFGSWIYGE